jgi:hypothetical protein
VITQTAEQERHAERKQQVGEYRADKRRTHHLEIPAFNATKAMINSGALPNVAFNNPPIASPVRTESCSVA